MPTPPRFFLANAFATHAHGGNQAAVVLLPKGDKRGDDDAWCRALGKDFDMPMTAIVTPVDEDGAEPKYKMRWWTGSGKVLSSAPRAQRWLTSRRASYAAMQPSRHHSSSSRRCSAGL